MDSESFDNAISFDQTPAQTMIADTNDVGKGSTHGMTRRELQVLKMMGEGLSNKMIADQLGISDHTAKFHVHNAIKKMDCSTRAQAAVKAVKMRIV